MLPRLLSLIFVCLSLVSAATAQEFASSSRLASGVWHKISVCQSGIFRLSNQQIQQMGFSEPSKVRIFGAGGRQLSFLCGADDRDDVSMLPAIHDDKGILFYAEGPDSWDLSGSAFLPFFNSFSRQAFYFVTAADSSDVIKTADSFSVSSVISSYNPRFLHALRTTNIDGSGRDWVGEQYNLASTTTPSISVGMPVSQGSKVFLRARVATYEQTAARTITVYIDDKRVTSAVAPCTLSSILTESAVDFSGSISAAANSVEQVSFNFPFTAASESAWLNYLALTATADLTMSSDFLDFRNISAMDADGPVSYQLAGAAAETQVWDVTNPSCPLRMPSSLSGSTLSFSADEQDGLHEYVAFNPSASFPSPSIVGTVANHDLHAQQSVNYLIITSSDYISYAERLGLLHQNLQGLSWRVTDVEQIYDEFSAGRAEAPAIRNYIKMLFQRGAGSSDELRYVLLLGSGSYDNFDRSRADNVIPVYESETPYGLVASYFTDDFYAWLEDGENTNDLRGTADVGVGRLTVASAAEAEAAVSKIESYLSNPEQGSWRARAMFIGCSGDANEHVGYSNRQALAFEEENPSFETIRIFSEAYQRVTASTGYSFPDAVSLSNSYLKKGCSVVHYTGHGGATGTGDGYFSNKQILSIANGQRCPFLVAATCTLAPSDQTHDNFSWTSILSSNGGMIGAFASCREVYGNGNYLVTRPFVHALYDFDDNGQPLTAGDAMMYAKLNGPHSINSLKYNLLADPALVISRPLSHYAAADSVNGVFIDDVSQPIMALSRNVINASIRTDDGQVDSSFNGTAFVTLFDKRSDMSTSGVSSGTPYSYSEWNSRLFSGEVPVSNGLFQVNFMLSKEINYEVGYGRLHVYAVGDDGRDVVGADERVLIGDIADAVDDDEDGPLISLWLDYPEFHDGDLTGSSPLLYATISDPQGINVSGQGVGHDISLFIDGDRDNAISLNDFFSYESGSYTSGSLVYQIPELSDGPHTLTLRAWDNLNNSSSQSISINTSATSDIHFGSTRIYVADGQIFLDFSHNCGGSNITVSIDLFALDGARVASGQLSLAQSGNSSGTINLSSRISGADNLQRGLYILRCHVSGDGRNGQFSKKFLYVTQ